MGVFFGTKKMGSSSATANRLLLSKIATSEGHGENSPYFDGWKAYDRNPFHPTKNPEGLFRWLSFDLIEDWIKKNPKASICTPEGVEEFKNVAIFQDYHGFPEFRKAVAMFMSKARGGRVTFDPNRVVMSGGATGANELVMFCLADPGDAFLVPSPYYPAFYRDLGWRTGVQIVPVHCDSSNNFQITKEALAAAYEKAQKNNINVKGLIITNPSNPLGTTLDRDTLESLVEFINQKNIHLVCDEIYAATVFSSPTFTCISEVIQNMNCNPNLIHIVYSLSKDMGLPGLRVGIVYSYNDDVVNIGRKMSSFGLVSSQTQHMLASMLLDEEFVARFLETSSKRLAKRHGVFTKGLEEVGINCLKSNAGLFCWMDLRRLLKDQTFDGEMVLWRVIVNEVGLNVSPGSSFKCVEPGWFRVCFANMDNETVEVALKRIRTFVRQGKKAQDQAVQVKSPKRWKSNLRLSFSSSSTRRFDQESVNVLSPHMMSPHSPLVRAKT
ncbi:ACC synthase 1 [Prunus dulcis]|uniref:1-aminocyclopropane-1-carboxylate synthase n=1 Tax=Prunus dulcis TaxID=3755 RepID=A0A4Y1R0G6_PRUDU|nr:ACC synthase 1 [Prunus dulcis]